MLRFIRKETDTDHPVSMHAIGEFLASLGLKTDKKASHKLIEDLALALNHDEDEHEHPWDQCCICYDAISPDGEETENGYNIIKHLYYRQEFSEKEVDQLQEAILLASRFHVKKRILF